MLRIMLEWKLHFQFSNTNKLNYDEGRYKYVQMYIHGCEITLKLDCFLDDEQNIKCWILR